MERSAIYGVMEFGITVNIALLTLERNYGSFILE